MEIVTLVLVAVTLIITALGVMFAIASVVLALMGFFGYRELSTMIGNRAEQAVKEALAKYPSPQQLKDELFAKIKADPVAPISLLESSIKQVESEVPKSKADEPAPLTASYPGEQGTDVSDITSTDLDLPPQRDDPDNQ